MERIPSISLLEKKWIHFFLLLLRYFSSRPPHHLMPPAQNLFPLYVIRNWKISENTVTRHCHVDGAHNTGNHNCIAPGQLMMEMIESVDMRSRHCLKSQMHYHNWFGRLRERLFFQSFSATATTSRFFPPGCIVISLLVICTWENIIIYKIIRHNHDRVINFALNPGMDSVFLDGSSWIYFPGRLCLSPLECQKNKIFKNKMIQIKIALSCI